MFSGAGPTPSCGLCLLGLLVGTIDSIRVARTGEWSLFERRFVICSLGLSVNFSVSCAKRSRRDGSESISKDKISDLFQ